MRIRALLYNDKCHDIVTYMHIRALWYNDTCHHIQYIVHINMPSGIMKLGMSSIYGNISIIVVMVK